MQRAKLTERFYTNQKFLLHLWPTISLELGMGMVLFFSMKWKHGHLQKQYINALETFWDDVNLSPPLNDQLGRQG